MPAVPPIILLISSQGEGPPCRLFYSPASTWSHLAGFHRPYLRAFRELGWQVHAACGGEPRDIPEADARFQLPFEKKMSSPRNFQAQGTAAAADEGDRLCAGMHPYLPGGIFHPAGSRWARRRPAVVNVVHGYLFDDATPLLKKSILLAAERLTAPQTDLLLTMNQWDFDAARRYRLGARVEGIPGIGVDFSAFSP